MSTTEPVEPTKLLPSKDLGSVLRTGIPQEIVTLLEQAKLPWRMQQAKKGKSKWRCAIDNEGKHCACALPHFFAELVIYAVNALGSAIHANQTPVDTQETKTSEVGRKEKT